MNKYELTRRLSGLAATSKNVDPGEMIGPLLALVNELVIEYRLTTIDERKNHGRSTPKDPCPGAD